MASFTDQILGFNPYVQQLPLEEMAKVGMYKQGKYEEGVQRIQSEIDRVAGLAVSRPIDKQYLQSKLNELGGKLKTVAAGDFSNFQLVNSVGGMIGQVSKDPFIMAAVRSTANDQKNLEQIDSDRRTGKLGPENEYAYSLQRQKYLNSGLKGADGKPVVFSGYYMPFRDVMGKLRTIAKDVGVDEDIVQNLFNPDGSVNRVMLETTVKGKDVNKVYDAFINGLDQGDYQQLAMTGVYKYRNLSAQDTVGIMKTSTDEYISTSESKKADLEIEIKDLKNKLVSAKPDEADLIKKSIDAITSTMKKIDDNIAISTEKFAKFSESTLAEDEDGLNEVKARIYTNNWLTSLSKDFADKTSHVKYLDNPLWKAIMEENKFALDKLYKQKSLELEGRKVRAAERANELKEKELLPLVGATGGLPGETLDFPQIINEQYGTKVSERNQKLLNLARWEMKSLGWSDDKISNWVKTQARSRGQSEEEVLSTWGTQTFSRIKSGTVTAPSELTADIDEIEKLNNFVSGFSTLIKTADERAKQEGGADVTNTSDIMRSTKPITVDIGGRQLSLSSSDQVDLAKAVAYRREIFSTKGEDAERQAAMTRLEAKFGKGMFPLLLGYGESQYANSPGFVNSFMFGSPITAMSNLLQGKPIAGEKTSFQKVLSAYTGSSYSKYKDVQDKVYKEVFSAYYPKNESVVLTEKSRPIFDRNLAAMFIDRPEYAEIKTAFDDPKSQLVVTTVPSITGFGGDNQISLRIAGKEGKLTQPIMMNVEQYQILLGKNPEEANPVFTLGRAIINASPDQSSNKNGIGSYETAYFGSNSFKNLTPEYRSRIKGGDFIKDATGRDVYYPKVYYTPRNSNDVIPLDIGVPLSFGEALSFPTMLDDNKLKNIISNR